MSERENTMELEINPYDHLIESEAVPVHSPVIFADGESGEQKMKADEVMEMIPLASETIYSEIETKKYIDIWSVKIETEDDFLVPDIEPDMETILNVRAHASDASVVSENELSYITGEIKIETLYASAGAYGQPVCVIPAAINIKKQMDGYKAGNVKPMAQIHIEKIEYRIVNERKYKIKIHAALSVKMQKENNYKLFNGIKDEPLQLKTEKISFANVASCKTKGSEVHEELIIKDEKIRPVKVLKSEFVISENHRQLTKEKLILNETIWVRILYMAEHASKGNLATQPMMYHGKIDHTQIIPFSKDEGGISSCRIKSNAEKLQVEINREATGFSIDGDVSTEVCMYNAAEKEIVTDFYHLKEEMTCDMTEENICTNVHTVLCEHVMRESIDLQCEQSGMRIMYMDARIIECQAKVEDNKIVINGKMHMEVSAIDDQDHICVGRKICGFEFDTSLSSDCAKIYDSDIFVKEMTADINVDNKVSISVHISAGFSIQEEKQLKCITNPCIIRSADPIKHYPITAYTVKEESLWDIAKKFKVTEEQITKINKPENISTGKKIVIVK